DAVADGSEEYLDSEKYQFRPRDFAAAQSLRPLIARVNEIRRQHPCLRQFRRLDFHWTDDPAIVCYSKTTPGLDDVLLMVVNLDPALAHSSTVHLDLAKLGVSSDERFLVRDLLTGEEFTWQGPHNLVSLDPSTFPGHILQVGP
ncbi:MAG: alpha-1,4-glucan--maltose-1-phosphate maltosyltransferase, partial [Candidatus Dormibacteria bacterium]